MYIYAEGNYIYIHTYMYNLEGDEGGITNQHSREDDTPSASFAHHLYVWNFSL